MITTIEKNGITWVNVKTPSKEDVDFLKEKFSVNELVAEELLKLTFHPKCELYNNHIYLILYFPIFNEIRDIGKNSEIDFILGRNFIITSHYESIGPFEDFLDKCREDLKLQEKIFYKHSGFIFFYVIRHLYQRILEELDGFEEKIDKIEEKIFSGEEKQMLKTLSLLKRDMLEFRKAIIIHESTLFSLEGSLNMIFGSEFKPYFREIQSEYFKIKNLFSNYETIIDSLYETNNSLLSAKINEVIKTLTIMAFVTFPLMLFSSLFSMNARHVPILGMTGDFWIILLMMAASVVGMFFLFKKKKWL